MPEGWESEKSNSRDSENKDKQSRKRSPRRRGRPRKEKKSRTGSEPEKESEKPLEPRVKDKEEARDQVSNSSSSSHKGGSVLIDKVNEPIEAALRAYGDRLAAQEGLPEKLKQYPNPREEKVRMMAGRHLIAETQTIMEGPLPVLPKGPIKLTPKLETILEVTSQKEKELSESIGDADKTTYLSKETIPPEEIPEADENLVQACGER